MGRLSTFAKNRILNLRLQKSFRIKQIALTLLHEDNIKVSRKSISTFLKKYIETKSIHDKPRSGRNKKLSPEEINLIGEVTRLNRDITAPKIKEYLNLNVSTYTILRASKLFEWNKLNPNSNEAKKAAALERQLNGESKRRRSSNTSRSKKDKKQQQQTVQDTSIASNNENDDSVIAAPAVNVNHDLELVEENEILLIKNVSSSPMVFATKILYLIFELDELIGHNVSGKTFNKHIKNKKALDEKRINYIRWLVENNFETNNKEELWKSCRTAINKSIRNNEIKSMNASINGTNNNIINHNNHHQSTCVTTIQLINDDIVDVTPMDVPSTSSHNNNNDIDTLISSQPNLRVFKMSDDISGIEEELAQMEHQLTSSTTIINENNNNNTNNSPQRKTRATSKTTPLLPISRPPPTPPQRSTRSTSKLNGETKTTPTSNDDDDYSDDDEDGIAINLDLLKESEILEMKNLYVSPMIFSTKVLQKLFTKDDLIGHNISGKTYHKNLKNKEPLDQKRIMYIKWLIQKYFDNNNNNNNDKRSMWKSCRKAINRVIRNFEIKEAKLIRCELDEMNFD